MMFLGKPIWLIMAYGVLGALFMPFLAITELFLLNTDRVPRQWRNGLMTNVLLVICAALFTVLGVNELVKAVT